MKIPRPRWRDDAEVDLPVNAINGNLIFARDRAAGVYRVDTRNYGFLSKKEKLTLHQNIALWAMKAEADFSLYRVCREYPADRYVDDTVSMIDERFADRGAWEKMLAAQAEHMRSMRSFTPEVYAAVSLRPAQRMPWSRQQRDLRLLRDADQAALDTLVAHIPARRALTRELQWHFRRAASRGVGEPELDPYWEPPALSIDGGVWEPGRADVQSLMPVVEEHGRYVHVVGDDGEESVQAMLVMGSLPKHSDYPGASELLFAPLEALDFPVDAVVHVRWLPNKKMRSICDDAVKDTFDELDDASHRFVDRATRKRTEEVAKVQEYYSSDPFPPGLDSFVCLAVGAPADKPGLLSKRVDRVRRAYGNVRLHRPAFLQAELFYEHFLKPDGVSAREYWRDYRRLLNAEQLAAMMPIGSNEAGSKRGIYIAHTIPGAKRPIKYDFLEASQTDRAGAVVLDGTLGGGKTFAGQLIGRDAVRRGSLVVDVDPRPDHSFEGLLGPELVNSISLDNTDDYVGRLDPLVVALPSMREELAVTYFFDLLPEAPAVWKTKIIDAVREVLRRPDPSSRRVVDYLLEAPDGTPAHDVGEALDIWSDWGLCRLAFGDGSTSSVDLAKLLTTIKVSGLSLPLAGTARESYDQSEAISVATFKLIVAYAMRLVSGDRSVHKVLMLDEVHAFTETNDGQRFLKRVLRMARSMNVTVILITQLIGDLEKLKDLIGVVFSFRQENAEQARANLRMLGLDEDNDRFVEMLCGFTAGRCLMRGLDGRVTAARIDPADEAFFQLADTNPTRLLERAIAT